LPLPPPTPHRHSYACRGPTDRIGSVGATLYRASSSGTSLSHAYVASRSARLNENDIRPHMERHSRPDRGLPAWPCPGSAKLERMDARYGLVSAFLLSLTVPLSSIVNRRDGPAAARRFRAGMGAALVAQQALIALALRRPRQESPGWNRHRLSLVDALTLSRGGTGAVMLGLIASGVRRRRGTTGWLGWFALI